MQINKTKQKRRKIKYVKRQKGKINENNTNHKETRFVQRQHFFLGGRRKRSIKICLEWKINRQKETTMINANNAYYGKMYWVSKGRYRGIV